MSDAEVPGITSQADAYVKTHHKAITGQITEAFDPENAPVSLFMAGSPGAGKTEASLELLKNIGNILRIDADELRCHFKECGYTGTNSHLFQKPASTLVHKIHDAALKKKISFLLDGTFSNESIARQNIQRSLKRERKVFIIFVYQAPQKAWHFVQQREKVEGRRIRSEDFAEKFCESQKVANKMKAEFEKKVILSLLCKNIDGTNKFYRKSIERIEDHITEKYSAEKIRNEIPGWDDLSSLVR